MLLDKIRDNSSLIKKIFSLSFILVLTTISLSGCFRLNYFLKEHLSDEPPPVHIASDANLYFTADVSVNPNDKYFPSPVPITLVQLKSNKEYLTANSNMIISNPEACLGASALEYYHFKMNPGQNRDILIKLRPETRYLAVIAKYHNPVKIKSSDIVPLPKLIVKDHYYTYVTVNTGGVEFIPE